MSRLKKLVLLAVALLAVAVAVNLSDPTYSLTRLLSRQTTLRAQMARHLGGKPRPLKDLGSESAKVQLTVFVQSTNHCHEPTISTVEKLAKAAPKRIRVHFVDTVTREGAEAAQKAVHCETGILVNGKSQFEVAAGGRKTQVGFHGPIGMGTPPDIVRRAIEAELAKQYGNRLTAEEKARLAAVWKSLPTGPYAGKGGMAGPKGAGGSTPGPAIPPAQRPQKTAPASQKS